VPGDVERPASYVRRFSAGASLNVLALPSIKDGTYETGQTAPPLYIQAGTTGGTQRIGGGVQVQVAFLRHFAVNAGLIYREAGYTMSSDKYEGTDNTSTLGDERILTSIDEKTRAVYYDLPLLVRFYGKAHDEKGGRWFVEGGGALRQVRNIKTSRTIVLNDGTTTTDNNQPSYDKQIFGASAGAGAQFIDPFGIRVVPEFRYTRWMGTTFNNMSTVSQRNQIEAVVSFTF